MTGTERFEDIKNNIICTQRERCGIGTLKEKTLHAVLKDYYAPDKAMQEIPVEDMLLISVPGKKSLRSRQAILIKCGESWIAFLPITW